MSYVRMETADNDKKITIMGRLFYRTFIQNGGKKKWQKK